MISEQAKSRKNSDVGIFAGLPKMLVDLPVDRSGMSPDEIPDHRELGELLWSGPRALFKLAR